MQKSLTRSLSFIAVLLVFTMTLAGCSKEHEPEAVLQKPSIEKLELGLANNGYGVIGRDFHFEADIIAGDKIDSVVVKIVQRPGEIYSKAWGHKIIWMQYKGAKNTNIHKHFEIPQDAPEGKYDLYVIITDENGSKLEDKRDFAIYAAENLPVDPKLSVLNIQKNDSFIYDYRRSDTNPAEVFKKGDSLRIQAAVSGIKGDGKMYILLIKNSANHRPETIEGIDFSKSIVYDVFEHKDEQQVFDFSNFVFDLNKFQVVRNVPLLTIGAEKDNDLNASPVAGAKGWETGAYSVVFIYKNTTYNTGYFKSVPFSIDFN